MKHTQGSWFLEKSDWTIRSKVWSESDMMADFRGVIIADLSRGHGGRNHAFSEAEANARLIAAAPDLLAACKKARQFIENGVEYGYIRLPDKPDPALETLPLIIVAIAKAEEKSPLPTFKDITGLFKEED